MKSRKGFTLVELLVVIIIIGILASVMSISMGKATASAKAATIIKNLELCKSAANLYYADHYNDADLATEGASTFLTDNTTDPENDYVPNWKLFEDDASVIYKPEGSGYKGWAVVVDFSQDSISKDIATALSNNQLYKDLENGDPKVSDTGIFRITLYNSSLDVLPSDYNDDD